MHSRRASRGPIGQHSQALRQIVVAIETNLVERLFIPVQLAKGSDVSTVLTQSDCDGCVYIGMRNPAFDLHSGRRVDLRELR
jgi:hypothetical protein